MRKVSNPAHDDALMAVLVDIHTLKASRSGNITGVISVLLGCEHFPERQWSDFPVVLLSMWLDKAVGIWQGRLQEARFDFMDGPFWFEVVSREISWSVHCKDDRGGFGPSEGPSADINGRALIESIVACAESVLGACRANSWSSRDISDLETSVKKARATI